MAELKVSRSSTMEAKAGKTREEVEAFLRSVPRKVHFASVLASAVGLLIFVRFYLTAWADKLATGKAVFYGLLIFALLLLNGFALIRKSRTGYMIVAVVVALPILGLVAQSLHLVVLIVSGNWIADKLGTLTCSVSLAHCSSLALCSSSFFPVKCDIMSGNSRSESRFAST